MDFNGIKWLLDFEFGLNPDRIQIASNRIIEPEILRERLEMDGREFLHYSCLITSKSKKKMRQLLLRVIVLSDTVYAYMIVALRRWKNMEISKSIRSFYHKYLEFFEKILTDCCKYEMNRIDNLPLTKFNAQGIRLELKANVTMLKQKFTDAEIDPTLTLLFIQDVHSFILNPGLSNSGAIYLKSLMEFFLNQPQLDDLKVENELFRFDYNTPSFFYYFSNKYNNSLTQIHSLYDQLDELFALKDRIYFLNRISSTRFVPSNSSIQQQVMTFLNEKIILLKNRLELRREEMNDREYSMESERMILGVTVAQLGFLIRIFMVFKIIPSEEISRTFAYFARNFRTDKTVFISAESLQKKSTDVEFSTVKKIKSLLLRMVNWINENYHTKDY